MLALIDGDGMPFEDALVARGKEGGHEAARRLKQNVSEYLKGEDIFSTRVVIRIYANLEGLARTYKSAGIISASVVLEEFVRGYNMEDPLCDFVDAGKQNAWSVVYTCLRYLHSHRQWQRVC